MQNNKIEIIVGGRGLSKSHMADCFLEFYRENPQLKISELIFGKVEDASYTDVTNDPAHTAFLGHELKSK